MSSPGFCRGSLTCFLGGSNVHQRPFGPLLMHVGRRLVSERRMQALGVVPANPSRGLGHDFNLSRPLFPVDQLRLVDRIERLGHGVIVRIPFGTHRSDDVRLGQGLPVPDRPELHAPVAVMDKAGHVLPIPVFPRQSHHQRVPGQGLPHVVRHLPSHDFVAEHIKNEHRVNPPGLGRNIGDVSHPKPVGRCSSLPPVHQIHGT